MYEPPRDLSKKKAGPVRACVNWPFVEFRTSLEKIVPLLEAIPRINRLAEFLERLGRFFVRPGCALLEWLDDLDEECFENLQPTWEIVSHEGIIINIASQPPSIEFKEVTVFFYACLFFVLFLVSNADAFGVSGGDSGDFHKLTVAVPEFEPWSGFLDNRFRRCLLIQSRIFKNNFFFAVDVA